MSSIFDTVTQQLAGGNLAQLSQHIGAEFAAIAARSERLSCAYMGVGSRGSMATPVIFTLLY